MKITSYSVKGTKGTVVTLPKELEVKINLNLLAQAVYVYEERSHPGLRKAQTRAEVNRTGKKLYKQKGTGGARHGSRRAPIFVGGGVALGPRPVRRILSLPQGLRKLARAMAFSAKAKEDEVIAVKGLEKIEHTKEVFDLTKKLPGKRFTFVLGEKAQLARKFMRNLKNVRAVSYKEVNAFDIVKGGTIVLDGGIVETGKVQKQNNEMPKKTK